MMKSEKLIRHYKTMAYWYRGLGEATVCHRASKAGIEYTEDERKLLYEADSYLLKAKAIVAGIYAARIGQAVVQESTW